MDPKMLDAKRRLFKRLVGQGVLLSRAVKEAFLRVPREAFLPAEVQHQAYADTPLPIGWRQTISAPHMCVMMLESLDLKPGLKLLEIGTGSGYHAALCAEMLNPSREPLPEQLESLLPQKPANPDRGLSEETTPGHVYTVERIAALASSAEAHLKTCNYDSLVTVITGDGTLGYKKEAPYKRILVTGAPPDIPSPLVEQLAPKGIMVIPVGRLPLHQNLARVQKSETGHVTKEYLCGVAFVPLIGKEGWHNE
jgi:protein-L-isoaspartate(D-aspartate) O-methyltransferase